MSLWSHTKAFSSLAFITLNLALWCVPLLGLALLKWALPGMRSRADAAQDWIYRMAVRIDDLWLKRVIGLRWETSSDVIAAGLSKDQNVVVVSNHVSWADILVMQSLIARRGPILKFLAKRELIFIPVFGAIFWAFDFPVLRRRTQAGQSDDERRRSDLAAIREACRVLVRRPAALVNFVEGTRFSDAKRHAQSSRYRFLLEPRVGGFSALLDALEESAPTIVDLTLKYPAPRSFWAFLSGVTGRIEVDVDRFESAALPRSREARAEWLADRWAIKEERIRVFRGEASG